MQPSKMKDDQLRLAIAEIVAKENGWIIEYSEEFLCEAFKVKGRRTHRDTRVIRIPNYPGDNNAAMALEEEICKNPTDRLRYIQVLQGVLGWVYNDAIDLYDLIHATARQRCEAWLMATRRNERT